MIRSCRTEGLCKHDCPGETCVKRKPPKVLGHIFVPLFKGDPGPYRVVVVKFADGTFGAEHYSLPLGSFTNGERHAIKDPCGYWDAHPSIRRDGHP